MRINNVDRRHPSSAPNCSPFLSTGLSVSNNTCMDIRAIKHDKLRRPRAGESKRVETPAINHSGDQRREIYLRAGHQWPFHKHDV